MDTPIDLPSEQRNLKVGAETKPYTCKLVKHDIIANHDEQTHTAHHIAAENTDREQE